MYGKCTSEVSVSGKKGDTDVKVTRNLRTCDQFTPFRDYVSPIALFKGLVSWVTFLLRSLFLIKWQNSNHGRPFKHHQS